MFDLGFLGVNEWTEQLRIFPSIFCVGVFPSKRESMGQFRGNSCIDKTYRASDGADPITNLDDLLQLTAVLRAGSVRDFLEHYGVQRDNGEPGHIVWVPSDLLRVFSMVDTDPIAKNTKKPSRITVGNEMAEFGQPEFWKLLATVENMAERIRENNESGKERDKRLELIINDQRNQASIIRDLQEVVRDTQKEQRDNIAKTYELFAEAKRDWKTGVDAVADRMGMHETRFKLLENQVTAMSGTMQAVSTQVSTVQKEFEQLKPAMEELIGIKNRLVALFAVIASVLSVIWFFGAKIWESLFSHIVFK